MGKLFGPPEGVNPPLTWGVDPSSWILPRGPHPYERGEDQIISPPSMRERKCDGKRNEGVV